jgi:hypothetical protein
MAAKFSVDEADWGDVLYVAHNIREADRREAMAAAMLSPLELLTRTIDVTPLVRCGKANGEPVVLFGVAKQSMLYPDQGTPWLVGTDNVLVYRKAFLDYSKTILPEMLEEHPYLENHVDARNALSIRYLRKLGFVIEPATPYGMLQRPFHRFHLEAV